MNALRRTALVLFSLLLASVFPGCESMQSDQSMQREAMNAAIRAEAPGDYFVGRRFYKQDYKMWGWVRRPGQPWSTAKLVMMNEQKVLAPDRQQGRLGADNNFEYRLSGSFSGESVYEPASDTIYPEFVLTGYEVRATNPPNIFRDPRSIQPEIRLLTAPM